MSINFQALVDGMSQQWQKERSESQMTLGEMIKALESMISDTEITGLGELDSYRGYYSDLAFSPIEGSRTRADILTECRSAMGKTFQGYKGGDYMMGDSTPLWLADYGCCGVKLMAVNDDGTIETATDDD